MQTLVTPMRGRLGIVELIEAEVIEALHHEPGPREAGELHPRRLDQRFPVEQVVIARLVPVQIGLVDLRDDPCVLIGA